MNTLGCICDCLSCDFLSESPDFHLITAARVNNHQMVKSLLVGGSDVNARDHHGYTALIYAAQNGNDICIDYLLRTGADVNLRSNDGFTALVKAAENGHDKCVKALLRAGAKSTKYTLYAATLRGHDKCMHLLLKEGSDVNEKTEATPILVHAAEEGYEKCVDLLIRAGADVNASGPYGDTALIKAARNGQTKCVELLIQSGADVNHVNNKSNTALMKAASHSRDKIKTVLLNRERDIHGTPPVRNTNCATMIVHSSIHCVKLLLAAGADVNKVNEAGFTALKSCLMEYRGDSQYKEVTMVLFAAGDTVDGSTEYYLTKRTTAPPVVNFEIPDYLLEVMDPQEMCLMDICRRTIRKHLLQMSHLNLFCIVPSLGIPSLLTNYLLYNTSLTCSGLCTGM